MSILTKIEDKDKAVKARSERVNAGVAHAAQVLHESSLGRRCPNLLKGIESESAEAKYQAATLVQLMENTAEYVQKMDGINLLTEADAYGNAATNAVSLLSPGVTSLTPKVVDIVNVFYPQMCGQYIADIQALDRQSGQIFTIKTRYSQKAAGVEAGDIVFEEPTDGTYTSEYVGYKSAAMNEEGVVEANPSSALPNEASVKVRAGSFIVRVAGKEVARDYGNGSAKVDGVNNSKYGIFGRGVSGELDAQTGKATVKFDKEMFADAITAKAAVSFEAAVDTETDVDLIRKIQFDIPNTPILAKEHPLMSSYSVAASLVMNAHLAIDTDELIANQIAGTIRWERDLLLIKAVSNAAVINPFLNFDCAGNGENLTLQQRYSAFTTHVSAASGIIQETAGRGTVEFIICSAKKGLTVIEQMEDFKAAPESKKPIGPYLAGTLREGTINVVAVPYTKILDADEVIFGFKGFQLGDSAIILAEWIPLYFTPTFQAPNLKNHKGALSFYDLFINKPEYLVKGYLKNFNQA